MGVIMELIVGIDLGTTYTVVSYIDSVTKLPVIIKNKNGNITTPSAIGFNVDNTYVIGEEAKAMEEVGNVNTASFYKLHMGDHNYKIKILGREYTAKDLSSLFLKRVIEDAERTTGNKISKAVITVPAYFEDAAKNDTLAAGQAAGLDVLNIINEPTAACVAYGLREDGLDRKILIYDLGGGTFDVTVARVSKESISVMGTIGHHQLGGRDWDKAVADWLETKFLDETGIDISDDAETCAANMIAAEKAKCQLTNSNVADITVDNGEEKCKFRLTRQEFEDLTSYQLGLTIDLINQLFKDIKITWSDIDGAVLVGGSTKMPMVKNYIQSNGIKILDGVHPDEAVSIGAAIQANISEMCALPSKRTVSSLTLKPGELKLDQLPGAKVIKDVIPHSLGMICESEDRTKFVNDIMITKNTPCSEANVTKKRELRVSKKKQDNHLDIYLLQGESDEPAYCSVAKKYCFYDIDFVNGGKTILEITFLHTINGTIDIRALQTETGKKLSFREEEIPEDMSWVTKSPKEVWGSSAATASGVLVMALDLSGSMTLTGADGRMAIDSAKYAMKNFLQQFEATDVEISIVGFSDVTRVMCNPTRNVKSVINAIDSLCIGLTGGGNAADPLPDIFKILNPYKNEPFIYGLVLTDGVWNSAACQSAISMNDKFVKNSFELIGMGFGTADQDFLKKISTKEELAKVDDISNLNANLSSIARVILN